MVISAQWDRGLKDLVHQDLPAQELTPFISIDIVIFAQLENILMDHANHAQPTTIALQVSCIHSSARLVTRELGRADLIDSKIVNCVFKVNCAHATASLVTLQTIL